jgi:hypothetical protein
MSGRGMKKWAPYASLIEQKGTITRMKQTRTNINKPLLSQEQAMQINALLFQIQQKTAKIHYFMDGILHTMEGLVNKVNFDEKYLEITHQRIPFHTLTSIMLISPIKSPTELYSE